MGASNDLFTTWNNAKTIFDPADSKKAFTIFSSAAAFRYNQFKSNYIGQKGSAIYARQISFLMVDQNTFDSNGPAYQYNSADNALMPYYKLLLKKTRNIYFASK